MTIGTDRSEELPVRSVRGGAGVNLFVGREAEQTAVRHALAETRIVTLTGFGGLGKTRLARELALHATATRAFRDGVRFVELAEVTAPEHLAAAVAEQVGVRDLSNTAPLTLLCQQLATRHMLLVLDNAEHLRDTFNDPVVGRLVEILLSNAPQLHILVTSHDALQIPAEREVRVGPLTVPDPDLHAPLEKVVAAESMQLLLDRIRTSDPTLSWDTMLVHEIRALQQLCTIVGGHPLALELIGHQSRSGRFVELLAEVEESLAAEDADEHGFAPLDSPTPQLDQRQRALGRMVRVTYNRLSKRAQLLWQRVAIFSGNFALEASKAICAGEDIPPRHVRQLLAELVQHGVLYVEQDGYWMLEPLRHYGLALVRRHREFHGLRQQHLRYYRRMIEDAALDFAHPREIQDLAEINRAMPNVRSAFSWALETPGLESEGLRLETSVAQARWPFFFAGLEEATTELARALTAAADAPATDRLGALCCMCFMRQCQGQVAAALSLMHQAQRLAEEHGLLGDPRLDMVVGNHYIHTEPSPDTIERALSLLEKACRDFQAAGVPGAATMGHMLWSIGGGWHADLDTARRITAEHLARVTATGAPWSITWAQWACALAEAQWPPGRDSRHQGDLDYAADLLRTALQEQRSWKKKYGVVDRWGADWVVEVLATLEADRGNYLLSAELLGGSRRLQEMSGINLPGLEPHHRRRQKALRLCSQALPETVFEESLDRGFTMQREAILDLAELGHPAPSADPATDVGLTAKEIEVLDHLSASGGRSYEDIAGVMGISARTVGTHLTSLLRKLGVPGRPEAAIQWRVRNPAPRP